ncbi:MAG TPA: 2-dehydropantoate 2-reductase [Acidimicrobiales bacterium]|nr:2-dehydropantoate 2-reductase [Acidimicrobiales bacterium]
MRYIVVGPGAVGGTVGGRLHQAGHEVVLVARGRHLAALRAGGLVLCDPVGLHRLPVPVAAAPGEVDWRADDVVLLATKSQDTAAAVRAVAAARGPGGPVVCLQNGVANERTCARAGPDVYGACVMVPAEHVDPGVVVAFGSPRTGIIDVGRYPAGTDAVAEAVCGDLDGAGFSSRPEPAVMAWKHHKLVRNLGNVLEAARGGDQGEPVRRLYAAARAEAVACFAAVGLPCVDDAAVVARRGRLVAAAPVAGHPRGGGSTWQSLARGTRAVETDYLNGEIVRLGLRCGVPTPVNAFLVRLGRQLAGERRAPGTMTAAELGAEAGQDAAVVAALSP